MRHTEGRISGVDGVELFTQNWLPESDPRAAVVIVHGVGEHSGRYTHVVRGLVEEGYAVYAYDHRGHGRSEGPRVHIDRWEQYREDLRGFLAWVDSQEPGRPRVVYGHSMGSLVVLDYLLERPDGLAGAIISGVALQPAGVSSPALIAIARVLTHVTPRLSMDLGIDASALTRDPEALAAYDADPLTTGRATVRWGTESLATVERVRAGMDGIDLPMLVLHGEADRLNLVAGAHELCEAVSHQDTTLRVYPDVFHEPHNDLGHEQVVADVTEWLGTHDGDGRP